MSPSTLLSRITDSWAELQLGTSFINTIVLSLGNLVFTVVVCGFAGYVLSKLKPRLKGCVCTCGMDNDDAGADENGAELHNNASFSVCV